MSTPFDRAVEMVLEAEGGYSNDPNDPGGETHYGISKRSYPAEDIANLTPGRAKAIYRRDFWDPLATFDLPESIAIMLFDMSVNMGKRPAVECLQRAIGVKDDGILGPVTVKVLKAGSIPLALQEITVRRIMRYALLDNFALYGLGWVRRSIKVLEAL